MSNLVPVGDQGKIMKNLTQFSDKTTETLINRNKGIQTTTDKWKIIREKDTKQTTLGRIVYIIMVFQIIIIITCYIDLSSVASKR